MVRMLQSPGVAAILAILVYLGTTVAFLRVPRFALPTRAAASTSPMAEAPQPVARPAGPSWEFLNPEIEQLVSELRQEKAALAARAKQLDELAGRLRVEQLELGSVTQAVKRLQKDFDKDIVRVQEEETANLKKLSRIYSNMEPDAAATILKQLDEATIVKIMTLMKEDETAPILQTIARQGEVESKLAASISERLRLAVFRKPTDKAKP